MKSSRWAVFWKNSIIVYILIIQTRAYPTLTLALRLFPQVYLAVNQPLQSLVCRAETALNLCCPGYSSSAKGGHLFPLGQWLTLASSQAPTQPLESPSMGWGESRRKAGRLMDWGNDSSTGEANAAATRKARRRFRALMPVAGRCPVTSWKARSPHRFLGKINAMTMNVPPPFPELSWQSRVGWGVERAFGRFGSAVLAVTALRPVPTPRKQPENPSAVQCSAAAETLLCYQLRPRHKHKHMESELHPSLTPLLRWFLVVSEII